MSADGRKEVRLLIRAAKRQGWVVERGGGGHYRLFPPDGHTPAVSVPTTPGRGRSLRNTVALLRRRGLKVTGVS